MGGALTFGVAATSLSGAVSAALAATPSPPSAPHIVVNAAGLGAALLAGDEAADAMVPVRGSAVLVSCPNVEGVYSDESWDGASADGALTYVVAKGGGVVACLGCAQHGATRTDVGEIEARAILERCAALVPRLRGCPVVGTWAGLRPVRTAGLRCERVGETVHCYGNGGSGVVISWGAAREVVRLAGTHPGLRPQALPAEAHGLPPMRPASRL